MFKLKGLISIVFIITIIILIGCTKKSKDEGMSLDLFDTLKGKSLANEYLMNVSSGDLEMANKLCDEELIKNNSNLTEGISKITGFQLDKTIASSDFAYFVFDVIRDSTTEPKSDLENYSIKVKRDGENYTIEEVKSKIERELYIKNKSIRIIGEDGGKSSLVISLNNIPKDTYLRDNKLMLYKEKVPNDSFGKVILGFTGKKVAISTKDEENTFICIVYIDDTLMKGGGTDEVSPGSPSGEESLSSIEDVLEKPVSSKVVSVDLLNNATINQFIFSKEDDNIAINYKDKAGMNRLNVYKTDDGSIIDTKFKELFSEDTYNIKAHYFNGSKLIFSVYDNDNSTNEITGKYSLDLKTSEMIKL